MLTDYLGFDQNKKPTMMQMIEMASDKDLKAASSVVRKIFLQPEIVSDVFIVDVWAPKGRR